MAAVLNIVGAFPAGSGSVNIGDQISVDSPLGSVQIVNLTTGFNSIAIPTGCTFYKVQLPNGNSQAVTLKGVTGDAGILITPAGGRIVLMPTSGQTTIGLTAAGAVTGVKIDFE